MAAPLVVTWEGPLWVGEAGAPVEVGATVVVPLAGADTGIEETTPEEGA